MADQFDLGPWQGVRSLSDKWYNNLQEIGKGGNSVVFLVILNDGPNAGTPYALKVFRRLSKPERKSSFFGEIEFLQDHSHPAIMTSVDYGDFGKNKDFPFLVSSYYGRTLKDAIKEGKLSCQEKVLISLQLISAITFLDSIDIVHRDIKPSNIFINGRTCVLGDFGLIKQLKNQTADDRDIIKTSPGGGMAFHYRTPDLVDYAKGLSQLTTKTDIYQLGLVLAELFTGVNPQEEAASILDKIILKEIGTIDYACGGRIRGTICSMLQEDPNQRATHQEAYQSMQKGLRKIIEGMARTSDKPF
ncbi:MAG: protein kinase [Humidesulfovibrio sp.]|nr:protein kinase [Humidesulfovibrio sp.]